MAVLTIQEVSAHNSESDCWIAIHGKVYNVTSFLKDHPGGKRILLKVAGTDASKEFEKFHSAAVLPKFGPSLYVADLASIFPVAKKEASNAIFTNAPGLGLFGDGAPFAQPAWYQDTFSPYYKDSHRRLRNWVRQWIAENRWADKSDAWEEVVRSNRKPDEEAFTSMGIAGLTRGITGRIAWKKQPYPNIPDLPCGIAEDEFDYFHCLILWDELSATPLISVNNSQPYGIVPVMRFAKPALRERVVPKILRGEETMAIAITEPGAGSDVSNISATATLSEDGKHFIINGEKKWITNGVWADWLMTAVRTGGPGAGGITLLLVPRGPGLTTRPMETMGGILSGTAFVTFDNVKCPVENVLGEVNNGFKALLSNFNHERWTIIVSAVRNARRCYSEALHYAHRRQTFGKNLIDHPIIRDKFAQMVRQIESTATWLESATYQLNNMRPEIIPERMGATLALLKVQATKTFEFCAREAAQIMGGIAVTKGGTGGTVEKLYRGVRASAIAGGSEEVMGDFGMRQSLKVAKAMGVKL
ncbi:acyl-CoA dehydrogenase NM domain-like protein [Gonapodya prolifera JEL478]|uniref:Acyl-CoA dehydrogenase NM domain-like protein n=1 Tax=Gonapodya prolifera (strain JEL478) TaxID=1344416 RepID=A0A139AVA7_GONPJ|nr:acyl-CoA dehydrogenase NM domain-like protein [Gonapodya prolifera JEL478]|eukprot:KXS20634.1 acyl-CoA dehydrogenase NM domain-like protein [Gonapodya prolifera JEL478]